MRDDPHPPMHHVPEDPARFLEVSCPHCHAEPGDACVRPDGRPCGRWPDEHIHAARRRRFYENEP